MLLKPPHADLQRTNSITDPEASKVAKLLESRIVVAGAVVQWVQSLSLAKGKSLRAYFIHLKYTNS